MFPLWVIVGEYPPERMSLPVLLGLGSLAAAWLVLSVAANWRLFEKAQRPGWKSVVPLYNVMVFLDIVDRSRWWAPLLFFPLLNFICWVVFAVDLARVFGKSRAFAIGLAFLNPIFVAILAFGDAQYQYDA